MFCSAGCNTLGYIYDSGVGQFRLLAKKEKLEDVLNDPKVSEETKRKIRLVEDARRFAEDRLGLKHSANFRGYVQLEDEYVTYTVSAAPKNKLEPYIWSFPIVGKVPYKGFFKKEKALAEKADLEAQNLDVYMRGVTAYSTLGWFADPLLSSMMKDSDEVLVETIIHELTHSTLFIKNSVEFNERLANFVGIKGMELFYFEKEGSQSPTVLKTRNQTRDSQVFSEFISGEIRALEDFYLKEGASPDLLQKREVFFRSIRKHFSEQCLPRLQTPIYKGFERSTLNNAVLLTYRTYYRDLGDFERVYEKVQRNWGRFFDLLKTLTDKEDPAKDLALL